MEKNLTKIADKKNEVVPGIEFCNSGEDEEKNCFSEHATNENDVVAGVVFCDSAEESDNKKIIVPGIEFCNSGEDEGKNSQKVIPGIIFLDSGSNASGTDENYIYHEKKAHHKVKEGIIDNPLDLLFEKTTKETAMDIAKRMIQKHKFLRVGQELYVFSGKNYINLSVLGVGEKFIFRTEREAIEKIGSTRVLYQIMEIFRFTPRITEKDHFDANLLSMENCVLNFRSGQYYEHSGELMVSNHLNYKRTTSDFENCPRYIEYLSDSYYGNENLMRRELEVLGMLLTGDYNAKKFVVLMGPGNTGKSKKMEFFASFFDTNEISTIELNGLSNRFAISNLAGKRITVAGDLPDEPLNPVTVGKIKSITGGDLLNCEYKGKNSYSFHCSSKLLMSANYKLKIRTRDDAFVERMLVLPMMKIVEKKDRNVDYFYKFDNEKEAIANLAIDMYMGVVNRKYVFSGEEEVIKILGNLIDIVGDGACVDEIICDFYERCLQKTEIEDSFVSSKCVYDNFLIFCDENGYDSEVKNSAALTRKLDKIFGVKTKRKRIEEDGKKQNLRVLEGYKMCGDKNG